MKLAGSTVDRVIALDFDGVVCDSVGESSLSAFKVCMTCTVAGCCCTAPNTTVQLCSPCLS